MAYIALRIVSSKIQGAVSSPVSFKTTVNTEERASMCSPRARIRKDYDRPSPADVAYPRSLWDSYEEQCLGVSF